MVILHVAKIGSDPFSGVSVVVPQHVRAQQALETVGLLNIRNIVYEDIGHSLEYKEPFALAALSAPFDRPDLVIFHECYHPEFLAMAAELRRASVPYIIVPHGALRREAQRKKWLKKKLANVLLFNRFIRGAAAIQCLAQEEVDSSRHGRVKFIGTNGIPMPAQTRTDFRRQAPRITYIGRLDAYHKGLDILLEGVAQAGDALRAAGCRIDMYGPDYQGRYANVERLIGENAVGDIVTLHPAVRGQEKEDILLDSDMFIQTSRFEGMPMGILEAMGYGLPCLVTEGTCLSAQVAGGGAGWGVETSPAAVAQGLREAVSRMEEWTAMGQNARNYVKENFAWEVIGEKTVRQYKQIIGPGD